MKRFALIFILFLVGWSVIFSFVQTVEGKTAYYVDFLEGSDSNTGKSPAASFKHCPGDDNANAKAKSTELSAGDSVIFKGGVAYKGIVQIKWSGESEANQIVYDGNSSGLYGKGKAIIDGELLHFQGFGCWVKGIKFVKINHFEIRNIADRDMSNYVSGILFEKAAEHITIENCYIHHVGSWTNDGKTPVIVIGIMLIEPTRCRVSRCEITATSGVGIDLLGGVDCVIENNNIHHYITWGIDIASYSGRSATGNIVKGNVIHDLYQYDVGFWGGDPVTAPHQNFIFIRSVEGKMAYKNIVDGNIFYNNYNFKDFGGTAMVTFSKSDRNVVTNNVLINPHSYFAIAVIWGSADNEIYNNVIYSPRTAGIRLHHHNIDAMGRTAIKNNIIIAVDPIIWETAAEEKGWKIDYNYYLSTSDRSFRRVQPYNTLTFKEWQASFGNDKNGKMMKSLEEFTFSNVNGYPEECEKMDFRLKQGSPLIDKGIKLQGFRNDFSGVIRPQGNGWDVGAHEFK